MSRQGALAVFYRDAGDLERAGTYASRLKALQPYNPQATALVEELEGR
jgi:hypothetical protein